MEELFRHYVYYKNFNVEVTFRLFHVSKITLSLATNTHLAVSMYFNLLLLRFCQVIIIIIVIIIVIIIIIIIIIIILSKTD